MIAILGGLGAALCWAVSTLCSSRSSRSLDPLVVVAWMMLVGLIITAPVAAAGGLPDRAPASAWTWLAISGTGNVAGLVLVYRRHGMAIASVLSSRFAALSLLGASGLQGTSRRLQLGGVAVVIIAVAVLSELRA